jgi:predicted DNA-binding protein
MGRPATEPTKPVVTLTLRVPAEFKRRLMFQSEAVGMTMTEYLMTLVERDGPQT